MKKMKMPKDLRTAAVIAEDAGWEITLGGSGHLRWRSPDGQVITTASSPGKRHGPFNAARAAKAQLRRAGLAVLHCDGDVV